MKVLDARDIFICNGKVARWQPGDPYTADGQGLEAVLKDALEGRPFFMNGSLVSHATIIKSYVKELFDMASLGLLRRALDSEVPRG